MIIKINENTYIKFDEVTKVSETLDLAELNERKDTITVRLAKLEDYSDESLLAWAKANYPLEGEQKEKVALELELTHIDNNLNEIYGN